MSDHKETIVYCAINRLNGKRYIGYTSKALHVRKRQHENGARSQRGECRIFHSAIRKYGEDAFEWSVLCRHKSKKDGLAAEISAIAALKPEYNISKGGQGTNGVPWTEERRSMFSEMMKGRVMSPEARERWRKTYSEGGYKNSIICLNDGRVFKNAVSAGKAFGITASTVLSACNSHRIGTKGGLYFAKFDTELSETERAALIEGRKLAVHLKRSASKLGHPVSEECRKKIGLANKGRKPMLGKTHSQETRSVLRSHGLNRISLFKGFSHLGPKAAARKVVCIDDGREFESASAAAAHYGVAKSALIELCLGQKYRKTVGGKRFAYIKAAA